MVETGLEVGVALEADVDVVCDHEGYVEICETEKLGELEHGVYGALEGKREEEYVRRERRSGHWRSLEWIFGATIFED